jgi:class 3 adenylate cyclase
VRPWRSLSARLVLAFMLLAGLALAVALVATTRAVEEAAEEKIRGDLDRTLQAFQQLSLATQTRIRDVAAAHTRDRTFKDVALSVNSDDSEAGLDDGDAELEGIRSAHEVILSADTDVFGWGEREGERIWALFNVRKRLVFTHGDDERVGDTVADLPVLEQALRDGSASALWSLADLSALPFPFVPKQTLDEKKKKAQKTAEQPAEEQEQGEDLLLVHAHLATTSGGEEGAERRARPMAVVLTGRWVKPLLLENSVEQGTSGPTMHDARARFAILAQRGAMASTGPISAEQLHGPAFSSNAPVKVLVGDKRYLVQGAPFVDVKGTALGRVFVMRSLDAEIGPILKGFRDRLLLPSVGVVLLALGLAVLLARHLSAPLVQLEAAARQVRLGQLDVAVPVRSADEVGRLTGAFNEMVAGLRQRDQIHGLFKRYLDPQVVDELIRNPEKAAPGGERRELTVLFSDLVGFTSLSEDMSPEALVDVLNGYFERATEVLGQHGATLDKFIGDAIMCFWNAPLPQEDHGARACLTALGLLAVVDRLAPELEARGIPRLDCRIGINTGPGVVGNLGSRAAQDYTVIGDSVNLASRLEGAAKAYGTRILVSEDTVRAARGAVLTRELDLLRVKGRQLPVRVYEVVAVAGTQTPAHVRRFAEGLAHYRARRFEEARAAFLASPEDGPSRVFAARCELLLAQPPPEDWDGVFSLETK